MNNNEALKFFENMSITQKNNPECVKMKGIDLTQYDADFIMRYANKKSYILDLGSGTGLIVNKISDKVKSIDCIEPFEGLSRHIIKSENIKVYSSDMFYFETDTKYDLITIFGTMHYFNYEEAKIIYKKYFSYIKNGGRIIIKNQFGIK